ncbi:thioredoxin family protein [Pedobacter sp. ASV28]|uniref:TlpA family protein disulfide reductase n=1 Tax=Pedobacter sp. ASV28 TaxID=2795123 RepID=UPI001E4CAF28|nr:redoxin domain-containing protein [Pedobacter sp. ASV28]
MILGICYSKLACAQTNRPDTTKALKIGDQVPDIEFKDIINWNKTSAKLSDFRGKLVILDFWATWCVPCISALPKLDSLQKQFKDEIVILPITYEKKELIQSVLKSNPSLRPMQLPFITLTSLNKIFPYRLLPHEVWIDRNGKFLATTNTEGITVDHINEALSSTIKNLKIKKDIINVDLKKPLLFGAYQGYEFKPENIEASSFMTNQLDGVSGPVYWHPSKISGSENIFIKIINAPVVRLYQVALLDFWPPTSNNFNNDFYLKYDFSRIYWEEDNCILNSDCKKEGQNRTISFSYELILPKTDRFTFKKYMLDDVNRYFILKYGIEGIREKRKVKCWTLTSNGNDILFKTTGLKPYIDIDKNKIGIKVVNSSIDEFMFWWLTYSIGHSVKYPIINETNYHLPVDLDLKVDQSDFEIVKKELAKVGLIFKLEDREIDMIVIRKKQK